MNQRSSIRLRRITSPGSGPTSPYKHPVTPTRSGVPRYLQRQSQATGASPVSNKSFSKQQLKQLLREIIGLEWMSQSNAKKSIQLSPGLKSLIQLVTSLSDEDLQLLWDPAPKMPSAVIKLIDNSLPPSVTAPLMKQLQGIKQKVIFQQKIPVISQKQPPAGKKPTLKKELEQQEKLFKLFVDALKGKDPKDKDQTTEALKKTLKAFFKTKEGKKLKQKALEHLLGKKGLPFTIITLSGVLAGMVANNSDIPNVPEIDISDSISLKFKFEGSFQQPKSAQVILKFKFGGAEQENTRKAPKVIPLPNTVYTEIAKLDESLIYKWLVDRAYWEYEIAGPDQEEHEQKFYKYVKNNPDSMPDTKIVAEHVARQLMEHGMKNRIRQLKGESLDSVMNFDMKQKNIWSEFYTLKGLKPHFNKIVQCLVPVVPYKALGLRNVMFLFGKHHPISIVIKRGEE